MSDALIISPSGILAVLALITSLFFFLEKRSKSNFFNFVPPLIFIYVIPVFCSNLGLIPSKSPVYDFMGDSLLPMILIMLLLQVNLKATIKVMGKGIFVMLAGTLGVVIGAPIALWIVKSGLGPEAWKGFGALAGSWIGGTGNMAGVAMALELDESSLDFGYAVITDNAVYLIWLPIMLSSKNLAAKFNKFTGISQGKVDKMLEAAKELVTNKGEVEMRHYLYLALFGFGGTYIASVVAAYIPPLPPIFSYSAYKILLVTFIGLGLSFTRIRNIPGSHALAMALIYLFVARMGAKADLSNLSMSAFWFILGGYIWIFIHGFFLLAAAKLFKVDVHTAAIASAANIGGAASAPIVAGFHNPTLVPVSILMAMIGYAVGTQAALLTAWLCHLVM